MKFVTHANSSVALDDGHPTWPVEADRYQNLLNKRPEASADETIPEAQAGGRDPNSILENRPTFLKDRRDRQEAANELEEILKDDIDAFDELDGIDDSSSREATPFEDEEAAKDEEATKDEDEAKDDEDEEATKDEDVTEDDEDVDGDEFSLIQFVPSTDGSLFIGTVKWHTPAPDDLFYNGAEIILEWTFKNTSGYELTTGCDFFVVMAKPGTPKESIYLGTTMLTRESFHVRIPATIDLGWGYVIEGHPGGSRSYFESPGFTIDNRPPELVERPEQSTDQLAALWEAVIREDNAGAKENVKQALLSFADANPSSSWVSINDRLRRDGLRAHLIGLESYLPAEQELADVSGLGDRWVQLYVVMEPTIINLLLLNEASTKKTKSDKSGMSSGDKDKSLAKEQHRLLELAGVPRKRARKNGVYALPDWLISQLEVEDVARATGACTRCFLYDHKSRNCVNADRRRCRNCAAAGHRAAGCTNPPVCKHCLITGHITEKCINQRCWTFGSIPAALLSKDELYVIAAWATKEVGVDGLNVQVENETFVFYTPDHDHANQLYEHFRFVEQKLLEGGLVAYSKLYIPVGELPSFDFIEHFNGGAKIISVVSNQHLKKKQTSECPEKSNDAANLICRICAGAGHIARDCIERDNPQKLQRAAQRDEQMDNVYGEFIDPRERDNLQNLREAAQRDGQMDNEYEEVIPEINRSSQVGLNSKISQLDMHRQHAHTYQQHALVVEDGAYVPDDVSMDEILSMIEDQSGTSRRGSSEEFDGINPEERGEEVEDDPTETGRITPPGLQLRRKHKVPPASNTSLDIETFNEAPPVTPPPVETWSDNEADDILRTPQLRKRARPSPSPTSSPSNSPAHKKSLYGYLEGFFKGFF
ncbi:hypothetical protein HDV00_003515 [Rhizophlyctis rosea]|nr:hypothetical protein HDV00_003515 [Rhizophlyctis rosea]